jgi:hypothetical protein
VRDSRGPQVIENWNSSNDFILYGKGGEFASNRLEDQEISMLSPHLLQVSLVYVNTLMIQQVLAEPDWPDRLTPVDLLPVAAQLATCEPIRNLHAEHERTAVSGSVRRRASDSSAEIRSSLG